MPAAAADWPRCSLLAAGPLAAQLPQGVTKGATVEGITEYDLSNGLRVLIFPDASKPTATINITYLVGSRMEGYGETGMAHLLEHMNFKGTPKHPNIPAELTAHGARDNASTFFDRTNYFETLPATDSNVTWALGLEADRMIHSNIAKKDLETEMTVVRNEYEMGENSPFNILFERTLSTAYLWHNYGKSTIGARSDIENVPIERLQAFYHKYYQPDNAVLVVAGKVDDGEGPAGDRRRSSARSRKPVRSLDRGNMIYPTYTEEPTQDGEREVSLRRTGDVQVAMALYHVPAGSHPDFAPVDVLTEILGNSPGGRLYKALVETKKASEEQAFNIQLKEPSFIVGSATMQKDQSLADAKAILIRTMEGVAQDSAVGRGGRAREGIAAEGNRPAAQQLRGGGAGADGVCRGRRLAPAVRASRPHQEGHAGRRAARGRGVPQAGQSHGRRCSIRRTSPTAPRFRR